jgi:hypothetical protein
LVGAVRDDVGNRCGVRDSVMLRTTAPRDCGRRTAFASSAGLKSSPGWACRWASTMACNRPAGNGG